MRIHVFKNKQTFGEEIKRIQSNVTITRVGIVNATIKDAVTILSAVLINCPYVKAISINVSTLELEAAQKLSVLFSSTLAMRIQKISLYSVGAFGSVVLAEFAKFGKKIETGHPPEYSQKMEEEIEAQLARAWKPNKDLVRDVTLSDSDSEDSSVDPDSCSDSDEEDKDDFLEVTPRKKAKLVDVNLTENFGRLSFYGAQHAQQGNEANNQASSIDNMDVDLPSSSSPSSSFYTGPKTG